MCGRFTLRTPASVIIQAFKLSEVPPLQLRFNIAPTQNVATVRLREQHRELTMMRWGLIPSWADDPSIGNRMINARSETAATKPSFRSALRHRRCLIVADGFYEWKKAGSRKQPFFIRMADDRPFAFAGLWDRWKEIESCTILTTGANELVRTLHDRMPVIVPPGVYDLWLDTDVEAEQELQAFLQPYPGDELEAYPVSTVVNDPRNDVPGCVEPVEAK